MTDAIDKSHSTSQAALSSVPELGIASMTNDQEGFDVRIMTAEYLDEAVIKVEVDAPRKVGGTLDKTLNFRVKGSSILFDNPEFSVRRNFQDFIWLENALVRAHPYLLVPMIEVKNRVFNLNDTRDDFKRCLELQRFLNKITSHPDLVKSSLLRDFLCEEDEEKFKQIRKQIDESQKTIEVGQIEVASSKKWHKEKEGHQDENLLDENEEKIKESRLKIEAMEHAVDSIQSSAEKYVDKGNDFSRESTGLADAFSQLLPEFEGDNLVKVFAKCQQYDGLQLMRMFGCDRFETYEMTKTWHNHIYSAKELISRYEQASERAEYYKQAQEKAKDKDKEYKKEKAEKIAQQSADIFQLHKSHILPELQRFENFCRKERVHWMKYYSRLRLQSYRESIVAWKGYLDALDIYSEEQNKKAKEAFLLKNLEKTSPFRLSLQETMARQKQKNPTHKIPYVLEVMSNALIKDDGMKILGIFRKSTLSTLLQSTKLELEKENYNVEIEDAITAACLIKLWMATIKEPVIPSSLYNECINATNYTSTQLQALLDKFPEENKQVVYHIVKILRMVAEFEEQNKMGYKNLAIVISPNMCRCPDMVNMLANTKKETDFVQNLLEKLEPVFGGPSPKKVAQSWSHGEKYKDDVLKSPRTGRPKSGQFMKTHVLNSSNSSTSLNLVAVQQNTALNTSNPGTSSPPSSTISPVSPRRKSQKPVKSAVSSASLTTSNSSVSSSLPSNQAPSTASSTTSSSTTSSAPSPSPSPSPSPLSIASPRMAPHPLPKRPQIINKEKSSEKPEKEKDKMVLSPYLSILKLSENKTLINDFQKYLTSEKLSEHFLLCIDLENYMSMFHLGEEIAQGRAQRIHNKWFDKNSNLFTGFFTTSSIKILSEQISRKENTWNLFDNVLEQLHQVLQGCYVKFILGSTPYSFDNESCFFLGPKFGRTSKPLFSRTILEDVPSVFNEDSFFKYPDLINIFREYLRSKKIDNMLLFYADVYNFKVRIYLTMDQEKKAARVIATNWLGTGTTESKIDLPQLEDYISSIQQKLNSQEISKELFQEPFQEIQVKLHGHYTEFVKIHNVKSSKSSALAKIQKKILSE